MCGRFVKVLANHSVICAVRTFFLLIYVLSSGATADVRGSPDVMPFSFSRNSALGKKATVTCVASSGLGPFRFSWTQDSREIVNTPRKYAKTLTENVAVMTIEEVTAEDMGNYTCVVSNAAGAGTYSSTLVVAEKPDILQFAFSKHVALGQKTMISCAAASRDGPLRLLWSHTL